MRLRWLIIGAWLVAAAAGTIWLPSAATQHNAGFGGLLPPTSPALQAQEQSLRDFNLPLLVTTAVVVQDAHGLSGFAAADVVLQALSVDQGARGLHEPYPTDRLLGALPLINVPGFAPPGTRPGTTSVTYLYFAKDAPSEVQTRLATRYAAHFRGEPGLRTYVIGIVPASEAQASYLTRSLDLLEIGTLAFVALVVGVTFRSAVAPLLTLGIAAVAYLVDVRLIGGLGELVALSLPAELAPLVVALLVGVLTDYCVFFFSGVRAHLARGLDAQEATRRAIAENVGIVTVAGLTVAFGTASLYVARLELFRAFGPGLAITVVVGLLSAVTLAPACLAMLGARLFWPSRPFVRVAAERRVIGPRESRLVGWVSRRRTAAPAALLCLLLLGAAAAPLAGLRLDLSIARGLPPGDPARAGLRAVAAGFAPGVTGPTEVLVAGRSVSDQQPALARFEAALRTWPGVINVIGPAENPVPGDRGVLVAQSGNAARVVVVFNGDPLGGRTIANFRALAGAAPALATTAGLDHVRVNVTGVTAIAAEVTGSTRHNIVIVLLAALSIEFLIIAVYLRALVAPLFLLSCSALTVAASIGLATFLFQHRLATDGLTFYVPFAAAVLLVALGSDYNVFGIASIWEQAGRRPLRQALRIALPSSTRAITTAGITLAGSFALVAIVPLTAFRELAFVMGAGLILDTFLVRSILTPSLLTLIGPASGWPGGRLQAGERAPVPPDPGSPRPAVSAGAPRAERSRPAPPRRPAWRPHRPGRGAIIRGLIGVLLVAGVLWGLDWAARLGAQSLIARNLQSSNRLEQRPEVHLRGGFFLPQVLRGRYDRVDVSLQGLVGDSLRIAKVDARLTGVHVPLHDLVTGHISVIPIDQTSGTAELRYDDLDRYLTRQGRPLTLARSSEGQLQITGTVRVLGRAISTSAVGSVQPIPGALEVTPTRLNTGVGGLDNASRALLNQRLRFDVPLKPLPFGQQVQQIATGSRGITITVGARHVLLPTPGPP